MCLQVKLLQDIDLHGVSWHQHKQVLAFISGAHNVTICDYDDSGNYHSQFLLSRSLSLTLLQIIYCSSLCSFVLFTNKSYLNHNQMGSLLVCQPMNPKKMLKLLTGDRMEGNPCPWHASQSYVINPFYFCIEYSILFAHSNLLVVLVTPHDIFACRQGWDLYLGCFLSR